MKILFKTALERLELLSVELDSMLLGAGGLSARPFFIFRNGFGKEITMEEIKYKEGRPLEGENVINVNSKKKLKRSVSEEVTRMWEGILDFAHVAVGDDERFKAFRGKVLRLGNNCIRSISKELDRSYIVEFAAELNEDIVEVRSGLKSKTVEVTTKRSRIKNTKEEN